MGDLNNMDDIIDFAIEKEREAIEFYRSLRDMNPFLNKKSFLHDIEEMEKIHIEILENIRESLQHLDRIQMPKIEPRTNSAGSRVVEISEHMSYMDILKIAIEREDAAVSLYTSLAEVTKDDQSRKLFMRLASEEAKHRLLFEELYEQDAPENWID